ncbi:MAG: NADH-quinone oxidoreductase subunit C [Deltaproteobacteria bacterium]|nr:NADH-quinone oxidoreductase subunit C [Deltaproteobacteria bacterium]MBW2210481.1 NADH-quinone oxidoreductase subunit C [Deltaproteobacteria bacterium]MBW2213068.1 NADH-quinone oxidoreductase subunit C [Deltaproteobacteria bacterium]MBW2378129.1 NADH-quinone oxidoreductase subunit C [Deltaproteobacteria bacterium]MBW2549552.1 NADH-quinone oxidoreductase subunit C [Deltaproteobacteria bacterium]
MSQAVVERLTAHFGERVLETSDAFGDHEVVVAIKDWAEVAQFMKDDSDLQMDHFIDLTAVDYPERESSRFDLLLMTRSSVTGARIRLRTYVKDGEEPGTLSGIWSGANWAEREVWDMFGIKFNGHPDMRRILLYDEFVGHPLRKDYPIDKAQPLVPYREVSDIDKLPPFGIEEGQPFARIDWESRLAGGDNQVSPAIGVQQGQRRTLSDSEAAQQIQARIKARMAQESAEGEASEHSAEEGSGQ